MLCFVVNADMKQMSDALNDCLAISLRIDGSANRIQIHNNRLQAKVIHQDRGSSLYFLGFGDSEDRGVKRYLTAIKEACKPLSWYDVFSYTSSFVTDGENMNTGARNGLWALCDNERAQSSSELPLLQIWCAGHRINLPWKSVTKEVLEVGMVIKEASSLSSYFSMSAVRTKGLQKIAEEFSYELLESVMKNWRASTKYFKESATNNEARGFLAEWTDKDTLSLTCFVADLLYVHKRFHQSFQDDDILIFDICKKKKTSLTRLEKMKEEPLSGGWEENFDNNLIVAEEENTITVFTHFLV